MLFGIGIIGIVGVGRAGRNVWQVVCAARVAEAERTEVAVFHGGVEIGIDTRIDGAGAQDGGVVHPGADAVVEDDLEHPAVVFVHEL